MASSGATGVLVDVANRVRLCVGTGALVLTVVLAPVAAAEPSPTPVPPVPGSSNADLADMVLDAIEHGSSAPSTTPVPAPLP